MKRDTTKLPLWAQQLIANKDEIIDHVQEGLKLSQQRVAQYQKILNDGSRPIFYNDNILVDLREVAYGSASGNKGFILLKNGIQLNISYPKGLLDAVAQWKANETKE